MNYTHLLTDKVQVLPKVIGQGQVGQTVLGYRPREHFDVMYT